MEILNSKIHSILDYVVVLFLLSAPQLFGLSDLIASLTYALAFVHLLLTLLTDFEYSLAKLVPLYIHGRIELLVSLVLITSPMFLANFTSRWIDQNFFAFFGVGVLLTWTISDYTTTQAPEKVKKRISK